MGKLQYINRKICGVKLGQVVAKDLMKRISSKTTHKAALRDPYIDLDVSGKELDDEAAGEIVNGLTKILNANNNEGIIARLEELCLAKNSLTIQSLALLTPVIQIAARDIKDLDLSKNKIVIETGSEVVLWESFLNAVAGSMSLRRIDFSDNPLGKKAFEVLARVHCRHANKLKNCMQNKSELDLMNLSKASGCDSASPQWKPPLCEALVKASASNGAPFEAFSDMSLEEAPEAPCGVKEFLPSPPLASDINLCQSTSMRDERRQMGLPSIPYIVLDNTGMNDACALYLSDMIVNHDMPAKLLLAVPAAKAGAPAQQLMEYDHDPVCRGIMYRGNDGIGNNGLRVLEFAERMRDHYQSVDRDWKRLRNGLDTKSTNRKTADPRLTSNATNINSETAKSKLQADILKQAGPGANDLWAGALRMLIIARSVVLEEACGRKTRKEHRSLSETVLRNRMEPQSLSDPAASAGKPSIIKLRFGLSDIIWAQILAQAANADEFLTREQQVAVVRWAASRKTLAQEQGELGKQRQNQIWMVLHGMDCLSYGLERNSLQPFC